ncbi:hypothetical protein WDW37_14495 [Bdellovibrionota bacterium FG-1]
MAPTSYVIKLLASKNRYLRRYLSISQDFLANALTGNLSQLFEVEQKREKLIQAIGVHNRKISDLIRDLSPEFRTPDLVACAQAQMTEEAEVVQSILKVDDQIIECIELEKLRLKKELLQAQKRKYLAGRFKSGWISESGEGLDKKV